jgi:hypothetical protein
MTVMAWDEWTRHDATALAAEVRAGLALVFRQPLLLLENVQHSVLPILNQPRSGAAEGMFLLIATP